MPPGPGPAACSPTPDQEREIERWALLERLAELEDEKTADPVAANPDGPADPDEVAEPSAKQSNQSEVCRLLELLQDIELWHTENDESYATFAEPGGKRSHVMVGGRDWKRHVTRRFYAAAKSAPRADTLERVKAVHDARARFEGPKYPAYVRVGQLDDRVYIDLGDETGNAVEVTATGWQIAPTPPVRFRRPDGIKPLTRPQPGGSLALLRPFLNLDTAGFRLFVATLLAALRLEGPFPILDIQGEAGSAKTTLAKIFRTLVDPAFIMVASLPRDEDTFMLKARNNWAVAFDNLSRLQPWQGDALCRLSTGGGSSKREHYSNLDEILINVQRPASRAEREFWTAFDATAPQIMGALYDAVVRGLHDLPTTSLTKLPRMADFALWVKACEPALRAVPVGGYEGWQSGDFLEAYAANRKGASVAALEDDAVGWPALQFLRAQAHQTWNGTATNLLTEISDDFYSTEQTRRSKEWPGSGRAMSEALTRLAPDFRRCGFVVARGEKGERRRHWFFSPQERATPLGSADAAEGGLQKDHKPLPNKELPGPSDADGVPDGPVGPLTVGGTPQPIELSEAQPILTVLTKLPSLGAIDPGPATEPAPDESDEVARDEMREGA